MGASGDTSGVTESHGQVAAAPSSAAEPSGLGCGIPDCNGNDVDDLCDLSCANTGRLCYDGHIAIAGCDSGYFLSCGTSEDCDDSGVPDECEANIECCDDADCGFGKCCGQITPYTCSFCIY